MSELIEKTGIVECDLAVIGAGITGMSACIYALNKGLSTVQIGDSGGLLFSSGLFDLMSVHPIAESKTWRDPWACIETLSNDIPGHPYAKLDKETIQASFDELLVFLNDAGLKYNCGKVNNFEMITAVGTVKHTFCVPETMQAGVDAYEKKDSCLIVDFNGLKEYSAKQIVATMEDKWPGLREVTIYFPDTENRNEIYTGHMARDMEFTSNREKLSQLIKPFIKDAKAVGIPAILGIDKAGHIHKHFEKLLGVPVFEIPTMPASVTGLRLKEIFETQLAAKGVNRLIQKRVKSVSYDNNNFIINFKSEKTEQKVRAKGIILATGRFLGKGLVADRGNIKESIFNLPVCQPEKRSEWHSSDFLDPAGHPINSAGLETDKEFRPLNSSGNPVYQNLYAAGSILAHQDWMRMKCGTGVAVSSAYAAVNAFMKQK